MVVCYVILFALLLVSVKLDKNGLFFDPVDRYTTTSIKGFFIGVVFLRHIVGYMHSGNDPIGPYWAYWLFGVTDKCFGQLMVVMFLFYSGYGVMSAIRARGCSYITTMPTKRILNTLANFDVAVFAFCLLSLALGKRLSFVNTLLAFTGWTAVGNSNWYIFAILMCYILTWIGGSFFGRHALKFVVLSLCLTMIVLSFTRPSCWYNTIMAYPAGCMYATYRDKVEHLIKRYYWRTLIGFASIFIVLFSIAWTGFDYHGVFYNAYSIIFASLVVILSLRIKVGNPILYWMGNRLFPIYIYQRIPMIFFASIFGSQFAHDNWILYILLCSFVTALGAWFYPRWEIDTTQFMWR